MTVRKVVWRLVYGLLARRVRAPEWAFMNYGFAPLDFDGDKSSALPALLAGDEPDRLCIQLYEHALGGADLEDLEVLEVGSGRGGGASYLSRYRRPRSVLGVDFSQSAVDLCRRERRGPGLTFVRGDALSLPAPDASFDAVVNIESSHCYESMPRFLSEVHRVLRPGGHFYFADLRDRSAVALLEEQLAHSGLELEAITDITQHVLAALRLDNARKLGLIDTLIPRPLHRPLREFAGTEGTRNYTGFERGTSAYLSARLVKSG